MALRSVGNGAEQIATGATGGRPTGIPEKGHLRYNTKNGHFEGYSPKDKKWRLLDYVPEPETLDDYIVDSNITENSGLIICENFISKAGTNLTVGTQNLVIYCFGDATINGTINANSKGALGASSASSDIINNSSGLGQGGSGGFTSSNSYAAVLNLTGSGGGRSGGGGGVRAGSGGAGGGGIAIKAIGNIENKGNITANGSNGGSATGGGSCGGSGGGSGGVVVLDAGGDCINTGQINVKGGNGGAGKSGNGGGGGGGGIVIMQAGGKSRQNGTVNRGGGSGSFSSGSSHTGAAGGSCGGKGGAQKAAGGMGVFSKFGSPFSI